MFGLLKKKFTNFTNKIFGKSKDKVEEEQPTVVEQEKKLQQQCVTETKEIIKPVIEEKKPEVVVEKKEEPKEEIIIEKPKETISPKTIVEDVESKPIVKEEPVKEETKVVEEKPIIIEKSEVKEEQVDIVEKEKDKQQSIVKEVEKPVVEEKVVEKEPKQQEINEDTSSTAYESLKHEKKETIKKSVLTSIKGIFSNKIKISESEVEEFLEDFELSLLEADVSFDSANAIITNLKNTLTKHSYSKNNLLEDIKEQVKKSLREELDIDCDINNYINKINKQEKPFIIMFIGPNGAGKTTTISKFANMYKNKGQSIVLASSDTFRAGSIQQLEKHADNLGIRIIKQNYGSDPAAVAYDAVSAAKASQNDLVLIDTAGRQDTNINLMQELKKIKRVVKPDLVIYIGESQAGQAIVDQIDRFESEIGLDGVILTKIDTDPKGGVAISILNQLKKPIFYIGTGQEYNDIIPFSAEYIINRII